MPRALVLSAGDLSVNDRNVGKLLDFFGISWNIVTIGEIAAGGTPAASRDPGKYCLLSSAPVLAEALQVGNESQYFEKWLEENASSVCVYGFQETDPCSALLRFLTNDAKANISRPQSRSTLISVTGGLPEMCGALAGLEVQIVPGKSDLLFDLHAKDDSLARVIASDQGDAFVRVTRRGLSFYLSACGDVIDIDTSSRKAFDVKQWFCAAVPLAMYLKWAFGDACWKSVETRACLIVDDPLLKPRYGFLRFRRALELMDEHNFTMSVAFIPWNQRRTDPKIVQLFQKRSDKLSIAIHGCDHTASEFGTRSSAELNAKTKLARRRMESLYQRTSLAHDRIMVFPQGEFSTEAGRVLKLNGLVAAVNTEVTPSKEPETEVKIADLWDVAISKYGTFPMFTRRYLMHGIENFAFDIFLGKPCLLVAHHHEFKDDGHDLIAFIDRLNSLPCKLVWGSLGDGVTRSCRVRRETGGANIVQIYANHVFADNTSAEARVIQFMKVEGDPDCLGSVTVNQEKVEWSCEGGHLRFSVTIPAKSTAEVRIVYVDKLGDGSYPAAMEYRVKTGLRRYLSETRDQYLSQSAVLNRSAVWVRGLLK